MLMERRASPPVLSMREHTRVAGEDARRSMIVITTSRQLLRNSYPNKRMKPVAGKSGTRNVASLCPATRARDWAAK